ncbi:hypothetical protein ABFS82_14G185000 [Erythranthe guttata]
MFFFLPTSCSSFFFTKSTIISSHFLLHSSVDFSPIHFLNGEIAAFHLQRIVPRREQQRRPLLSICSSFIRPFLIKLKLNTPADDADCCCHHLKRHTPTSDFKGTQIAQLESRREKRVRSMHPNCTIAREPISLFGRHK